MSQAEKVSHSETPAELTLAGWLLPNSLLHLCNELIKDNKWDVNPLMLYDEADEEKHLILPQQYKASLHGATIHTAFHLIGWNIKETSGARFNLEVKDNNIEEAGSKPHRRMHVLTQEAEAGGPILVTSKEGPS